ncbi:unnamed protein product [Pedinophyceae sp. YPF-701]|nr:unnamed protein product [Pedinophyceae sp. YPF-701]
MVFPHLTAVAQKHAAKGLVVVGITQETDTPQLRGFVSGQGDKMGYSVASSEQAMMTLGTFASIGGIPHAIVVDRTGTVLYSGHPMQPGFEQAVEQACARGPVTETREELSAMGVAALKKILRDRGVGFGDLLEKSEFVERILERCT